MPLFHHGLLRVAVASPRVTVANPRANAQAIIDLLQQAETEAVSICVFPELCITGYTCSDLFGQQLIQDSAKASLDTILKATLKEYSGLAIVGLPWAVGPSL